MSSRKYLPAGDHPLDQASGKLPPVDYQLDRIFTYLRWNREHFATFMASRDTRPEDAERELHHLDDSIENGYAHFLRIVELLQTGHLPSPELTVPRRTTHSDSTDS
jgi:hypothetical protein